jgi:Protein of unknown function (DUF2804)
MRSLPVRGPAVRQLGLPLPPARMPLLRGGRPLKRWRYVGVYQPELMLCVGEARVAGLPRRWWAVALPDGALYEGGGRAHLACGVVRVRSAAARLDLVLDEGSGVEVASPHGRGWIWTRKQACVPVRGRLSLGRREWTIAGDDGFIDDSAGYHARETAWRWSAGVGRGEGGERVAWNLVEGVHDGPEASERTVWVDGEPREVGPQPFARDLSAVGDLRFTAWSVRADDTKRLVVRSRYRQPFGTFAGELPGGPRLAAGQGVMEWHDARW